MHNNIMIDTETLGTTADAVILSIGAVRFSMDGVIEPSGFYASLSIDSQPNRRIQEDTLMWWMEQSEEARKVFKEPKMTLEAALTELRDFINDDDFVWSNGASFDIPMLEHAFKEHDLTCPWKFWNSRCVRTYRGLPGAGVVPKPVNDHHALSDAVNQAKYVQAIHAAVFGKKVKAAA